MASVLAEQLSQWKYSGTLCPPVDGPGLGDYVGHVAGETIAAALDAAQLGGGDDAATGGCGIHGADTALAQLAKAAGGPGKAMDQAGSAGGLGQRVDCKAQGVANNAQGGKGRVSRQDGKSVAHGGEKIAGPEVCAGVVGVGHAV